MYRQLADIDPRYRESAEESLVETAQLMAALIEQRVARRAPLAGDRRAAGAGVPRPLRAPLQRRHLGFEKTRVELRMTVVDRQGKVVFDSLGARARRRPLAVARRLPGARGQYGARTTPDVDGDPRTSVMYVAAPLHERRPAGAIVGAVSVGKPVQSFGQFVEAARRKTLLARRDLGASRWCCWWSSCRSGWCGRSA